MLSNLFHKQTGVLSLAVFSLCISGCIPPDDINNNTLTHKSVRDRGLAIIGVVSAVKDHAAYSSAAWSKTLSKSVKKYRNEFPLLSAANSREAMGGDDYSAVMKSFKTRNSLSSRELNLISRSKIISRYAMLARIEGNALNNQPLKYVKLKNGHGEVYEDRQGLELTSTRIVTVSAKIYDLETGLLVWQDVKTADPENVAVYGDYSGKSFPNALATVAMNKLTNGSTGHKQPDFPEFKLAFTQATAMLVKALP